MKAVLFVVLALAAIAAAQVPQGAVAPPAADTLNPTVKPKIPPPPTPGVPTTKTPATKDTTPKPVSSVPLPPAPTSAPTTTNAPAPGTPITKLPAPTPANTPSAALPPKVKVAPGSPAAAMVETETDAEAEAEAEEQEQGLEKPAIINTPTVKPVEKDGKLYYPASVVDPNAPQQVYLGEGSAFRTLPAQVVHSSDYGLPVAASTVLPPIPTLRPRYYKRAIGRVTKSLELLDRAYDALSAHLKQLTAMRAKVKARLDRLNALQLKHGYMLLPDAPKPALPVQVSTAVHQVFMNALETEAETEQEAEAETEAEDA